MARRGRLSGMFRILLVGCWSRWRQPSSDEGRDYARDTWSAGDEKLVGRTLIGNGIGGDTRAVTPPPAGAQAVAG